MTDQKPTAGAKLASDGRPDFLVRLGVMLPCSEQDVKEAYLAKAKVMHPDIGGNKEQFIVLQTDYERAVQYCKFHAGRSRWLSECVERYVEQQQVAEGVQSRGGRVTFEHLDWLKQEIGEDFAQVLDTIAGIRFSGNAVGDAELDYLATQRAALDSLHWLDLSRSTVTDRGLARLAAFTNLRKIDLRETAIGNASLKLIRELPRLEWLGISGSRVNWLGRFRLRRWLPEVEIA